MPAKKTGPVAPQERPKRAALYMRVSTVYQVDKDSLPMQRQELKSYCEMVLGIKDYVYFEDAGYSGKNTDRPDYQKMMGQIRSGLFTHLVVWKIDRISRNLLDFASMYEELKELGVTFISKSEQFDTSNAMGEAMLQIILVFAELERKMTSERVTATMINRASNGTWNGGRVPFGYLYDKDSQTFTLHPEESAVASLVFDLYEQTRSVVQAARTLNERGYRSRAGNEFSPVTVWLILRNPWYKGTYRYNYYKIPGRKAVKAEEEWVIVDDHHPAIIDAERFARIQATLDNNARFRNTPGRSTTQKNIHIFSGLLWCAACGAAYTASPGRVHASGYRPSKYGCPSLRKSDACGARYTSDTVLGEFLINYILNIINAQRDFENISSPGALQQHLLRGSSFSGVACIDEDGLNSLYNMLSQYSPGDSVLMKKPKSKAKVDPELQRLRKEKRKQERALERLNHIYLYSDGQMSDREYIARKQEITDSLQEANEAIGMVTTESWAQALSDDDFLAQASAFMLSRQLQGRNYIYFERLAQETDPEVLKSFFHSLIDAVYLRAGRVETIVFRNGLSHTFAYKKDAGG